MKVIVVICAEVLFHNANASMLEGAAVAFDPVMIVIFAIFGLPERFVISAIHITVKLVFPVVGPNVLALALVEVVP